MSNDYSPRFVRQFYSALKVICTEFFLGRSKRVETRSSEATSTASTNNVNPIEATFDKANAKSYTAKASVMQELIDSRVSETGEFSFQNVLKRIDAKQTVIRGDRLHANLLGGTNDMAAASDAAIAQRLEALTQLPVVSVEVPLSTDPREPVDQLMREYVALSKQELNLRTSLGGIDLHSSGGQQSSVALEERLSAVMARKEVVNNRIRVLREQNGRE